MVAAGLEVRSETGVGERVRIDRLELPALKVTDGPSGARGEQWSGRPLQQSSALPREPWSAWPRVQQGQLSARALALRARTLPREPRFHRAPRRAGSTGE